MKKLLFTLIAFAMFASCEKTSPDNATTDTSVETKSSRSITFFSEGIYEPDSNGNLCIDGAYVAVRITETYSYDHTISGTVFTVNEDGNGVSGAIEWFNVTIPAGERGGRVKVPSFKLSYDQLTSSDNVLSAIRSTPYDITPSYSGRIVRVDYRLYQAEN